MLSSTILLVSFRNVTRHARRSAIAVLAVAFGIVAMLLAAGFIEDILYGMREATIETQIGHIQITRPRYLSEGLASPFQYLMPNAMPERGQIEKTEHVNVVSPRLSFNGFVSLGETTLSFLADGVEPDKETKLAKQMKILKGENLDGKEPKSVILGRGLAAALGAKVGDKVVLVVNTERGSVSAVEVTVRGVFSTLSKAYDDVALRLPLVTAQQVLKVQGVHRWVLLLDRTESTEKVVESLKQQLANSKLEIVPWTELADFYNKTVTLFSRQVFVMKLIIAAIIVLSISNTMMMSIMERTGEIGTSMALGIGSRNVLSSFLTEGFLLGIAGAIMGLFLGSLFAFAISSIGIDMPPPPGATDGFVAHIRVTPGLVLQSLALAVMTALIASLYPAWKASRLEIVDALRHNR